MAIRSTRILLSLALVLNMVLPVSVIAGEVIAVIVNRDNGTSTLSPEEVRMIYNNNMLIWPGGAPVVLYDLDVQNPIREMFSRRILGMPPYKVAENWAHLKITNQAKNPPVTVKSQALIIRRVSREKGAIGYVSYGMVKDNPDVRIVGTIK